LQLRRYLPNANWKVLPFSFKKARTYLAAGKYLPRANCKAPSFITYLQAGYLPLPFKARGKVPCPILKVPSITFKQVLRYLVQSVVRYFQISSIGLGGSLSNLKGNLK
jgi:hypothetical protein